MIYENEKKSSQCKKINKKKLLKAWRAITQDHFKGLQDLEGGCEAVCLTVACYYHYK